MATEKSIQLTNPNTDTITVKGFNRGYKTLIKYPFDIQELEVGTFTSFDNGAGTENFDIRECMGEIILTAADQQTLNNFLNVTATTSGRAKDLTLDLITDSGFFPFGPDKGDKGPFTVTFQILSSPGIGPTPYKHFRNQVKMVNTGAFPAYTLPSEVGEGGLTIGTITNNRFPIGWFDSDTNYRYDVQVVEGSDSQYIDRGESADNFRTSGELVSNESKAAAVIKHLTQTVRNGTFTLAGGTDFFIFGRDKGSSGTYTVRLLNEIIEIVHELHDRFRYSLRFGHISG